MSAGERHEKRKWEREKETGKVCGYLKPVSEIYHQIKQCHNSTLTLCLVRSYHYITLSKTKELNLLKHSEIKHLEPQLQKSTWND